MDALDQDILAVFSRRATGIAACTRGVKVFLNGNLFPISIFKDYVNLCLRVLIINFPSINSIKKKLNMFFNLGGEGFS
jgi:DNA topoisomerase-2